MKGNSRLAIALVATSITASLPNPVNAQAVPQAVQVCWSNAYCSAATVIIGGITYWAITRNGQTEYLPYGGYLENPEGERSDDEWYDYIWGDNLIQAQRRCQEYANQNRVQMVRVERVGRGNRYACYVRRYRA